MTTRDEVLAMAEQAGIKRRSHPEGTREMWCWEDAIERFHALAVAKEREECAKVAETPVSGEQDDITRQACDGIAKRIRARSAK